jgi:galactokinase
MATVINSCFYGGKAAPMELAKMGQFSENVYFGKKSGLLDQSVCSVGGLVSIDFFDAENPKVEGFVFDFAKAGYDLFITDTGGSHADLTADYVAIRSEMESVANHFGKKELCEVQEQDFFKAIFKLRKILSDRAILRAMHFFSETNRAKKEAYCLKNADMTGFLQLVNESGQSSELLLQNLYSTSKPLEQALGLGIHYSKRILEGRGAVRVHGGGFAGTIQAFVPLDLSDFYQREMDHLFGENACHKVSIRPCGGVELI